MVRWMLVVCFSLVATQAIAAEPDLEKLIDQLVTISEPGCGYSGLFSGSEFLPYDDTEQLGTFVLGGTWRNKSETLKKLVEAGVEAVPVLLKHIGDQRPIKLKPL